jgi:hypothetical protein
MKQAAPSSIREVLSGRKADRQQANGVNNEDYLRHPRHRHRACAGSPASAQEAAPSETFKGPRVGVTLGYDKSRSGSSVDIDNTRNFKQSIDGLLYGGEIGYDVPLGSNLVVGADAELTDSTAKWTAQGARPTRSTWAVFRPVVTSMWARGSVMRCRPRRCST